MATPPTLGTDRLMLRLLRSDHLDVVHTLFSSDGHTIGDGPVHDQTATAARIVRRGERFHEAGLAWYGLWDDDGLFLGSSGSTVAGPPRLACTGARPRP